MQSTYDVVVVGGGAVGAACARELAGSGRRVLVLDRPGEDGVAWRAAGGMLTPQVEARQDDAAFRLGVAGRARVRELAHELAAAGGGDIGFWQEGAVRVAQDEDDEDLLKSRVAWQRQAGQRCDWLDADETRERWPWLGKVQGALWAPHEAAVDPQTYVEALLADAVRLGAVVERAEVTALDRRGDKIVGVIAGQRYPAERVVLAAGAWAGRIDGLVRPVSVEPVRGQMAALPWPADVPRAIVYGRECYVLHRQREAIVGSTMEFAGFRSEVTSAGLARIFTAVSTLWPALAKTEVRRTWAGLRPMTPDGLPIVGPEPRAEGLWYATGHGRNGILLAGITGVILRQLFDREATLDWAEALRPERFWEW